jgi:hypothetical protein
MMLRKAVEQEKLFQECCGSSHLVYEITKLIAENKEGK